MYRVLLVDDDPHILDANEKFLRRKGCEVFCAGTAEDALRVAAAAALDAGKSTTRSDGPVITSFS